MNLKEYKDAKKAYVKKHKFGSLSIQELHQKAKELGIFVYGNKFQILKCFDQSEYFQKLWNVCLK